jgi:type VI secretion system secreted protein VgrG
MAYTQNQTLMSIDTPLGTNVLLLSRFSGKEGMSRLFEFDLELLSEKHDIQFKDIIGKPVAVRIKLFNEKERFFHGIISRFTQKSGRFSDGSEASVFSVYSATMVPLLWMLTRTADSRIFQNKTVPDIIEQVFSDQKFSDYEIKLSGAYEKKEYCVQYRETDFNFVSRLMEQEGIFYYFRHEKKIHTLVVADSPSENEPCPNQPVARCQIYSSGYELEDVITGLQMMQEIRAAKYTVNDYNFKVPNSVLKSEVSTNQPLASGEREIYDYPAEFLTLDEGDRLANIRIQEEEAQITTISGTSQCRDFTSGYTFDLKDFYRSEMNDKSYLLTAVFHDATEPVAAGSGESVANYRNTFTCIPHDVPFRPLRLTPKPVVDGSQPAVVVGPKGEEIYPDEFGRVKVQFFWDREGKKDENSSCWIRVRQQWAGANWGAMFIPRIGHEVIVDFVEGDPDRPIIIGGVYNGNNKPPYDLPAEKTKSTIMSNSTIGGGGANEFRFEDKKGSEEVYLHGQKDWTIAIDNDKNQTVGHDETLNVANNRTKSVGVDQSESIGANKKITVGSSHSESVAANMTQTVGVNKAETIGAAKELTIGAAYQVTVGAAMNETVGAAKAEEIGGIKSVNVGADSSENIGSDKSVDAGKNISESAGKDVSISSGKKMMLTSGDDFSVSGKKKGVISIKDQLTIKVGKASITLKKNGDISLKGVKINVNGSGDITIKGAKILEN